MSVPGQEGREKASESEAKKRAVLGLLKENQYLGVPTDFGEIIWSGFLDALLNQEHPSLAPYAKKPETFDGSIFRITTIVSDKKESYKKDWGYGSRGRGIVEPLSKTNVYLDAPFAYAMLFKNEKKEKWEVISVAGFIPDFKRKRLLIDQLQGGNTKSGSYKESNRACRARMKFAASPENILVEQVQSLAERTGMEAVGLRKPGRSCWEDVKRRRAQTPYERIGTSKGWTRPMFLHHFIFPLVGNQPQNASDNK